jgi:hypothetical protein
MDALIAVSTLPFLPVVPASRSLSVAPEAVAPPRIRTNRAAHRKRRTRISPESGPNGSRLHIPTLANGIQWLSLVAAGVLLLVENRRLWFIGDDWDFLAQRGLTTHTSNGTFSIWMPHNEHWSTLPILLWRALFSLFGVDHYVLYALPVIVAHLVLVRVLWRFMLRHQVDVWVAVGASVIFAFLGTAWEDLAWAFQIGFVGSTLLGVLAFIATESSSRSHFWRWVPIVWLLAVGSLMCSMIGVPMVATCGLLSLVLSGFKRAVIIVSVPAGIFLWWYAAIGHVGSSTGPNVSPSDIVRLLPDFVWTGLSNSLGESLGGGVLAGSAALVVLIIWTVARGRRQFSIAAPTALAFGALVLYVVIGIGRVKFGVSEALASRYIYTSVALLLPLIALAITDIVRFKIVRPLLVAGLAAVLMVNVIDLNNGAAARYAQTSQDHRLVNAAAWLVIHGSPYKGSYPSGFEGITAGEFARLALDGKLPVSPPKPIVAHIVTELMAVSVSADRKFPIATSFRVASESNGCVQSPPVGYVPIPMSSPGVSVRLLTKTPTSVRATLLWPGDNGANPWTDSVPIASSSTWLNIPAVDGIQTVYLGNTGEQIVLCK